MVSSDMVLLMSVLVILMLILGPFLTIWAVNVLFGTAIPFTLKTWFASLILSGAVSYRK